MNAFDARALVQEYRDKSTPFAIAMHAIEFSASRGEESCLVRGLSVTDCVLLSDLGFTMESVPGHEKENVTKVIWSKE